MDIIRRITESELGGELSLTTKAGAGSTFTLRIPLTLTILDAFSFAAGQQRFVVPVSMVDEIIDLDGERLVKAPADRGAPLLTMIHRRGEPVPLLELETWFTTRGSDTPKSKAIVVRKNGAPFAFAVDRVLTQQEVVVRPLEDPLVQVQGVTGSTDLGDGRPTLVVDLMALTRVSTPAGRDARPRGAA
jgi:two-component system chemotaxis sensor kinase CheA